MLLFLQFTSRLTQFSSRHHMAVTLAQVTDDNVHKQKEFSRITHGLTSPYNHPPAICVFIIDATYVTIFQMFAMLHLLYQFYPF